MSEHPIFRQMFLEPHSPEWHAARADGVSGSDVPSIMERPGAYGSRFDLHYEKVYRDGGQYDDPDDELMLWGTLIEPLIRDRFAALHPELSVAKAGTCINRRAEWRRCNPDGWVFEGPATPWGGLPGEGPFPLAGLEIKNVDHHVSRDWDDADFQGLPQVKYDQVQWCMDVTGVDVWFVVALFGGNRLAEYQVVYEPEYAVELRRECESFWRDVQRDHPPEPNWHPATFRRLHSLYPTAEDTEPVTVPQDLADDFRAAADLKRLAGKGYKTIEARLLARMGNAKRAVDPGDNPVASRSVYPRTTIDSKRLRKERPDVAAEYSNTKDVHRTNPASTQNGDSDDD